MLELFGHAFVKSNHLFKRSILLIKAWCTYDSRTLGSRNGLIASHALEVMLMCLFAVENPNSLRSPLHVLRRFLAYYATFDWDRYAVTVETWLLCSPYVFSNIYIFCCRLLGGYRSPLSALQMQKRQQKRLAVPLSCQSLSLLTF